MSHDPADLAAKLAYLEANPAQVAVPLNFEDFNHPQRAKLMSIYKNVHAKQPVGNA